MELSNVATVLIARMESHPTDFDYGERFGYLGDSFNNLIGIQNVNMHFGAGRFAALNDTDREALAEAWRARMYKALEKEVMDAMFKSDAEFEEEKKKFAYPIGISQQSTILPMHNTIGNGYQNAAQNSIGSSNTGLLGSAGSNAGLLGGLTGIFK
jgi:hypothetical protein